MRICRAVLLTNLVWRYADVVSLEGFTPDIPLYAGVGTLSASGPTLSSRSLLPRDQIARCGSHANVIRRSRLSPDVAVRALIAHGLRRWYKCKAGKCQTNEK